MPAAATVSEFVDLIRKSGVIEEARLVSYLKSLKSTGIPNAPDKLAGFFVRDGLLSYFQAEQLLMGKWKRFSIGKYRVLERLGSGGMGQVFLCEHKLMRRRVAVKVLPTTKADDPSSLERFYREARAAAALDHPNIVRAYDIDQDDNLHFLVMEYVDGASLQELVKKFGPMDVLRTCHYMYWCAIGLQHAHESGLIHRDIKPANILIDRTGTVKILDMGLARFFNDHDDILTRKYDENILGTADYLSPEQATDSHTVDGKSDIYSLGATFYFMLTGQPPFPDGTVAQKLVWHQKREPQSIQSIRPEVPDAVNAIVVKMMQKRVEDRFQTPSELAQALQPLLTSPITAPPDEEMPVLSPVVLALAGMVPSTKLTGDVPALPSQPKPTPEKDLSSTKPTQSLRTTPPPRPIQEDPKGQETIPPQSNAVTTPDRRSDSSWDFVNDSSVITAPPTKGSKSSLKASSSPAKPLSDEVPVLATPTRSKKRWIRLGGVLTAVIGIAVIFILARPGSSDTTPKVIEVAKAASRNWTVTLKGAGADATTRVASVSEALSKAAEGDRIVLGDPEWEEVVTLTNLKSMTIESAPGQKTIWRAPKKPGAPTGSILRCKNTSQVSLSRIAFDCQGIIDAGVVIEDANPGLTISEVELIDPKVAGLTFVSAHGEGRAPIQITHSRVFVRDPMKKRTPEEMALAAVQFDPAQGTAPQSESGFIQLNGNRFEGPFREAMILIGGSTRNVDIRGNRLWNSSRGIFIKPLTNSQSRLGLLVQNNTFSDFVAGALFLESTSFLEPRTPTSQPVRFEVQRNFFQRSTPLLTVLDKVPLTFLVSKENVKDMTSTELPESSLGSTIQNVTVPVDPASDATFLEYDATSPLAKILPGNFSVGASLQEKK
jgi:eukaryotic-like serine/threonine-protein kinase